MADDQQICLLEIDESKKRRENKNSTEQAIWLMTSKFVFEKLERQFNLILNQFNRTSNMVDDQQICR